MDDFLQIIQFCSLSLSAITAILVIVKPIREKVFGTKHYQDGIKCVLRGEMLRIYYHNKDSGKIRQYEYESFVYCYNAYKSLKGNSFIDKIYQEIKEMEVVS